MMGDTLKAWRKAERTRLLTAREALSPAATEAMRQAIDANLERAFPQLAAGVVAFCWPIRNEYDARPLAKTLRQRGALTALPVVIAAGEQLVFREWHPGIALAKGALGIPYPAQSRELAPATVLLPMNGWDTRGYRLGYGGGFFDRTFAALEQRPLLIGVSYELARMDTIHPQAWDIPMDWVVTEGGVYPRNMR